jgi:predicted DCC family thiol-disulfide oxidoreductase YuxK
VSGPELTLYFDGKCPFCRAGMDRLAHWDRNKRLAFVDIAAPGFDPSRLGVDMAALNRELHGQARDGRVLVGVDCMLRAYPLAGQAWRVLPLRVPGLRSACSWAYRLFARHRYLMSRVLGYRAMVCRDGVCERPNPFFKR